MDEVELSKMQRIGVLLLQCTDRRCELLARLACNGDDAVAVGHQPRGDSETQSAGCTGYDNVKNQDEPISQRRRRRGKLQSESRPEPYGALTRGGKLQEARP